MPNNPEIVSQNRQEKASIKGLINYRNTSVYTLIKYVANFSLEYRVAKYQVRSEYLIRFRRNIQNWIF